MCMAIVTFFFCICSIRTNLVLWLVFVFIDLAFIMLMATYWTLAEGMTTTASHLQTARKFHPSPMSSIKFIKRKPTNTVIQHRLRVLLFLSSAFLAGTCSAT